MKKTTALIICLVIAAVCYAQNDPVEGYWLSIDENTNKITAGWQIYQENGLLYGKIVSITAEPKGVKAYRCKDSYKGFPVAGKVSGMEVAGPPWIYGLTKNTRNGEWAGGRIINPEDGKDYNCRIIFHHAGSKSGSRTFQADTLEMRGEIGLGIGRSQFWQKSDLQTTSNLWPK